MSSFLNFFLKYSVAYFYSPHSSTKGASTKVDRFVTRAMTVKRRGTVLFCFLKKKPSCHALNYKQTRPRLPQAQELAEGAGALPHLGGGGEEDETGCHEEKEENPGREREEGRERQGADGRNGCCADTATAAATVAAAATATSDSRTASD